MEEEIKKFLDRDGVVIVIGLPESGRSYQLREIGKKNNWLVVDIPAEVEPSLDNFEGVIVVNSLDSITNDKRITIWRKLLTYYHQNPGKVKFVFGQGREEVDGVKELLGNFYLYYQTNRVWWTIEGGYWPLKKRASEVGNLEGDGVVETIFEVLWESMGDQSQKNLMDKMRGARVGDFGDYLIKTGVVVEGKLFSPLFEGWLKRQLGKQRVEINEERMKEWERELSYQEYEVLKLLWSKRGQVVTRAEIAGAMWSSKNEEKYSDWAIDQIMSKIRKKLGDVGEKRVIGTVKGKGFVFGQE